MARLVIDVDSDFEDDKNGISGQGHSFPLISTGANGNMLDTKPDIKKLLFSGKSPLPPMSTAEETVAGISGRRTAGTNEGRPYKRIKTELGEAPVDGADQQRQVPGAAFQNCVPRVDGPFEDVKPKLELVEKDGGERAPEKSGGMRPAGNKLSGNLEPHTASKSNAGRLALAELNNTKDAGKGLRPGTGASEPDPDDGPGDGDAEDVDARILKELEEEVRQHKELLRKKQKEMERGAAGGGGQGPSQSQGLEGGKGSVPESQKLVRSIGVENNAAEGPPRRAGGNRQFWHAGEYEVQQGIVPETTGALQPITCSISNWGHCKGFFFGESLLCIAEWAWPSDWAHGKDRQYEGSGCCCVLKDRTKGTG